MREHRQVADAPRTQPSSGNRSGDSPTRRVYSAYSKSSVRSNPSRYRAPSLAAARRALDDARGGHARGVEQFVEAVVR